LWYSLLGSRRAAEFLAVRAMYLIVQNKEIQLDPSVSILMAVPFIGAGVFLAMIAVTMGLLVLWIPALYYFARAACCFWRNDTILRLGRFEMNPMVVLWRQVGFVPALIVSAQALVDGGLGFS